MIRCARCNRKLANPVLLSGVAFGSRCAQSVAGARQKRRRKSVESHAVAADPRQLSLEFIA